MLVLMNAIAQASSAPVRGPKLDNRRVLAGVVDLAIVAAGAAVILLAGDALSGDGSEVRGALSAVILGWALYYYFALESGGGQTIGKKLMKLRVVRADGSPAGMREVAVRTILRVIDGAGAYIVGLIVMLATGDKRQRIGDLAAGTVVIDAGSASLLPAAPAPVAEAAADDGEPEEVDDDAGEPAAATATITLPSRPAPPETLADLSAAEAPAVPEMRPFPPVDEPAEEAVADDAVAEEAPVADAEPVVEEPVDEEPVAAEPVADAPVADAPAVVMDQAEVIEEPVAEDSASVADPVTDELPDVTSPSIEELARDVEAVQADAPAAEVAPELDAGQPIEAPVEEDGPVTVKSVETVSAIDLIMGGSDPDEGEVEDAEDSASR